MELTSENVETIIKDCLYDELEISDAESIMLGVPSDNTPPEGSIVVEGIVHTYAFNPDRLKSHEDDIKKMIRQLPSQFLEDVGGGWSFLNLCMTESGVQWTGLHWVQEQFYALAAGLGLAEFQLPREMWAVLPGNVPYIVFRTEAKSLTK